MECETVPYPRVPCTLGCLERAFLALFATFTRSPSPFTPAGYQAQCFNYRVILIKMAVFTSIFTIFKSGSLRVLTCFKKYFIFHNESIYCPHPGLLPAKASFKLTPTATPTRLRKCSHGYVCLKLIQDIVIQNGGN